MESQRSQRSKISKKVTFSRDTHSPKPTVVCKTCSHRNITPDILEMNDCTFCQKTFCINCVVQKENKFYCLYCYPESIIYENYKNYNYELFSDSESEIYIEI